MDQESSVISGIHAQKYFGNKQVLEDISPQVNRAETFGILGPSGSGMPFYIMEVSVHEN